MPLQQAIESVQSVINEREGDEYSNIQVDKDIKTAHALIKLGQALEAEDLTLLEQNIIATKEDAGEDPLFQTAVSQKQGLENVYQVLMIVDTWYDNQLSDAIDELKTVRARQHYRVPIRVVQYHQTCQTASNWCIID